MDSAAIVGLVNLGFGGVIILLIIMGYLIPKPSYARLLEENADLRRALETERQRANEVTRAGQVTNQLIGALVTVAGEHRDDAGARRSKDEPLNLTGGDLGL